MILLAIELEKGRPETFGNLRRTLQYLDAALESGAEIPADTIQQRFISLVGEPFASVHLMRADAVPALRSIMEYISARV